MTASPATDGPQPIRRRIAWRPWLDGVAIIVLFCSVMAGTATWWWIGDLFVHFRMPYAIVLVILTITYGWMRAWRWLIPVGLVLAVNVALLLPLFVSGSSAVGTTDAPLRLMIANVFIGNTNAAPLLEAVRQENPDVLLLMEVDDRWMTDVQELRNDYPYVMTSIRDEGYGQFGAFGMALFSRVPLGETTLHRLGTERLPVQVARIEHDGRTWTLVGAHPYPPVSTACSMARDTLLRQLGGLVHDLPGPKVVMGDLNITRWSPHFEALLESAGVEDSSLGFGYQATWPDFFGVPIIPIDHVLISDDIAVVSRRIGSSIDSDHRPVIVDLAVRGD